MYFAFTFFVNSLAVDALKPTHSMLYAEPYLAKFVFFAILLQHRSFEITA